MGERDYYGDPERYDAEYGFFSDRFDGTSITQIIEAEMDITRRARSL